MSLGRNIAKVTFNGKSHLFNRDAELILSSCLISHMSQISMANQTQIQQKNIPIDALDPPQNSDLQEPVVK